MVTEVLFGRGFLGGTGPLGADWNLLLQLGLGLTLLLGAGLARRGHYRAHGICQATAFGATVLLAVGWMIPSLRLVFLPGLAAGERSSVLAAVHATLGTGVLLLGGYVLLVAGTGLMPARLRFRNYKPWMRALLALWWVTIGLGVSTYGLAWLASH